MNWLDNLTTPGVHSVLITGSAGLIEGELTVPADANPSYIAILGHPHSLQGGTMQNKVVTTLVRVCSALNIASIRFNFRGVGRSEGDYDAGLGESDDMLFIAQQCLEQCPDAQLLFAGFSFGSYVTYRAAAQCPHALLVAIAPSVEHFDYAEFAKAPAPWVIVQGDEDEVVAAQQVFDFAAQASTGIELVRFADTGHFFHGKLIELKSRLLDVIKSKVADL